jgi:hypothetical protein
VNKLQKITVIIFTLGCLVLALSLTASTIFQPNRETPVKKLLPTPTSTVEIKGAPVVATWVWKSPTEINGDAASLLEFAAEQKINTVYLYIDEYIDIYETSDKKAKEIKMADYEEALKHIISEAQSRGITIHAMAGNSNYSYDSHEYIPPIIIEHVYEFNKKNPGTPLAGIQFDIEFYDNKKFFQDIPSYTASYLKLVDNSAKQVASLNKKYNQNLQLGFVIPFWFDGQNDYFEKPILPNVIESLSKTDGGYVVVMAYRNNVKDVLEVSMTELDAADKAGIKVLIAQEVAKNTDQKITYYGMARDEIKSTFNQIIGLSSAHPSFVGICIHDLTAFMETR